MWSYSGDPSTSDRDAVRFHMQDTDEDDPLYQDEELEYLLMEHGNPISAAIEGLERLLVRYSRNPDMRMGQTWLFDSDRFPMLEKALERLKAKRSALAVPYSGGLLQSEFDALDSSTETDVLPAFRRDPRWAKVD